MNLSDLLKGVDCDSFDNNLVINDIAYDSRKIKKGDCFVAINGHKSNGNNFIESAIKKGAKLIITDSDIDSCHKAAILKVRNSRKALSKMASNFHKNPSKKIQTIGITGTNGKTTIAYIVKSILNQLNHRCGSIGTLGFYIDGNISKTTLTTPESLDIERMLSDLLNQKVENVVLEVSSHALKQYRVDNIDFNSTIFTNLSQDHLDYHITMQDYFKSKSRLFLDLKHNACSVINIDDNYGQKLYNKICKKKISFSVNKKADIYAIYKKSYLNKSDLILSVFNKKYFLKTNLIGDYNISNILASIGGLICLGYSPDKIINKINNTNLCIPGRMELISKRQNQYIYIDYAHTPDAYKNFFSTLKKINSNYEIIALFGCGGNRDSRKRPKMAEIAELYCDKVVLTSDNPRKENLNSIIKDIKKGFKKDNYIIKKDRKEAIRHAINLMSEKSILAILGKGRENYQVVEEQKVIFSDVDLIRKYHES